LDDIDSIASYISRDSTAYASSVVAKIIRATRTLNRFPFAGRVVPEFEINNIRERFVYSYRIIYRVESEAVTGVAVIHGRRQLETVLES
jgi:plasmid stabilization system protein ParE